jgi:hypothetical protein
MNPMFRPASLGPNLRMAKIRIASWGRWRYEKEDWGARERKRGGVKGEKTASEDH